MDLFFMIDGRRQLAVLVWILTIKLSKSNTCATTKYHCAGIFVNLLSVLCVQPGSLHQSSINLPRMCTKFLFLVWYLTAFSPKTTLPETNSSHLTWWAFPKRKDGQVQLLVSGRVLPVILKVLHLTISLNHRKLTWQWKLIPTISRH